MPTIHELSSSAALAPEDEVPFYSAAQQDTRKVALPALASYLQAVIEGEPDTTVYALNIVGSTFTAAIEPAAVGANVWAQLTLGGTFTFGVIALPGPETRGDSQEVLVTCTNAVAVLSVTASGATVTGAPPALSGGDFFRMRFDQVALKWFRVG